MPNGKGRRSDAALLLFAEWSYAALRASARWLEA